MPPRSSLIVPMLLSVLIGRVDATEFRSERGLIWDFMETDSGTISNGTVDAYDGAYYLEVNGVDYYAAGAAASPTLDGRSLKTSLVTIGGLLVRRHLYVPKSGGDFARFLDVIQNPTLAPITVRIAIHGNLGSDSATVLNSSASGDLFFDLSDHWLCTDDFEPGGDPSLAHVVFGPGATSVPIDARLDGDNFRWVFEATVPPRSQISVLTFAVQKSTQAEARSEAEWLVALPPEAVLGIEHYLEQVINF